MDELYGIEGRRTGLRDAVERPIGIDADVIAGMLVDIYEREFDTTHEVHPGLYEAVRGKLRSGVEKGLQAAAFQPEDSLKDALRRSADVFAAFKVHRCQNDVARRLVDADGRLRSFEEWRDSVLPITSHQCGQWLRTEYNTAVLRAQQAADWKRFEEYADVLPNLEWMPSTSATPGADHQVFWHTVRPVNDPFWNQHRPGDRWNCKCSLEATDAPVTEIPRTGREIADGAQAGLENNPGVDGKIFSETHPYVTEAYPGAKEAVERIVNGTRDIYKHVPTEKGAVRIHPEHGKNEVAENTSIAVYLANKHGYDIELLPRSDVKKSADTYNHTLEKKQEYKVSSTATKSSIDNNIRDAKKQADSIVIRIDSEISLGDLQHVITDRVKRSPNITDITLVRNNTDATYTRSQILSPEFKIQPEDFE